MKKLLIGLLVIALSFLGVKYVKDSKISKLQGVADFVILPKLISRVAIDNEVDKLPYKLNKSIAYDYREGDTKWKINITRIYENLHNDAYGELQDGVYDERLYEENGEYFFELGDTPFEKYKPVNYLGTGIIYSDLELENTSAKEYLESVPTLRESTRKGNRYSYTYYNDYNGEITCLILTLKGNEVKTLERIGQ